MNAQHTPGPWTVEEPMDHELWIVEADKQAYEWRVIAGLPWPDERTDIPRTQVEANARLIAAAPSMLRALKTIALHAPSLDAVGIRELADEAVAKAEGR